MTDANHILYHEHLRIPATLEELHNVYTWADEHLTQTGVPESKRFDIMLALSEAVTNAIRHGSAESKSHSVDIEVVVTESTVNLSVRDQGKGFAPDTLPDPTAEANLHVPNGRGVYLIKTLADDVQFDFSEDGTTVSVRFIL